MKKLDDTMRKLGRQNQDGEAVQRQKEADARGRDLDERIEKLVRDIHRLISQIPPP